MISAAFVSSCFGLWNIFPHGAVTQGHVCVELGGWAVRQALSFVSGVLSLRFGLDGGCFGVTVALGLLWVGKFVFGLGWRCYGFVLGRACDYFFAGVALRMLWVTLGLLLVWVGCGNG